MDHNVMDLETGIVHRACVFDGAVPACGDYYGREDIVETPTLSVDCDRPECQGGN